MYTYFLFVKYFLFCDGNKLNWPSKQWYSLSGLKKYTKKTQHLELPYLKIEQQLMAYVTISILPSTSYKPRDRVELLTVPFRTYHLSFVFHIMANNFDKGDII